MKVSEPQAPTILSTFTPIRIATTRMKILKNILLSAVDKTVSEITSDISKTESQISSVDGKISTFAGKYGENVISASARALELFNEFEGKINEAESLEEITSIIEEYKYSYDKTDKIGEIFGLFGIKDDEKETYKTHSGKEAEAISKEMVETKIKKIATLQYTCILNSYTRSEDVSPAECARF